MSNSMLNKAAERLGLHDEANVMKKTEELLRVLRTKSTIKGIGDYAKAVLCLDLATSLLGTGFDKETALTLSGLKKSLYQNHLNMLSKVLQVDKLLTVSEVCVQLSCTVLKELAEDILMVYGQHNTIADMSHPQYITCAVYTAGKLKSIKLQKSQLVTLSHLKPMQWKELEEKFMKFVTEIGMGGQNSKLKRKNALKNNVLAQITDDIDNDNNVRNNEKLVEDDEVENYDVWRARILAAAVQSLSSNS